jgi:hypothetical protein
MFEPKKFEESKESKGAELSKEVREKGIRLFRTGCVKKELDTDRRMYFAVKGETEEHSVILDKTRNEWSCDCKFSSMKNRECSHIYACKLSRLQ